VVIHWAKKVPERPGVRSSSRRERVSTTPVAKVVCRWAFARRNAVSSTPTAATPVSRSGSSTSGAPWSRTGQHRRPRHPERGHHPPSPSARPHPRRHASIRARSVHEERDPTAGWDSVHVRFAHVGSCQRHTRFTTPGSPDPAGGQVPHPHRPARVRAHRSPHEAHRTAAAVLSTACSSSPSRSNTASSTRPSSPSNTMPALPSTSPDASSTRVLDTTNLVRPQARHQAKDRNHVTPAPPRLIPECPLTRIHRLTLLVDGLPEGQMPS